MRINWSKIILTLVLILIGGLFYSTNSINSKRNINDIIVDFESTNKLFITQDSILKLLPTNFSEKKSVDINHLESLVNSNGFIKNSEAYVSIEGDLIIKVQQRNPIGRIISDDVTFYIDDESKIMTTSKIYSSNVPVIFNYSESISYDRIYEICDLVYNDDFLRKHISRVNFINKLIDITPNAKFDVYGINNIQPIWADHYFKTIENINKAKGEVFNIGGGIDNSLSLLELFSTLEEILDVKLRYNELPFRESDQLVFVANNSKANNLIGWSPKMNMIDGIKESINWGKKILKNE